ncbi:MAG: metallophosphoesterase family protein [Planctomycetota bacterium]|nr:metallophosphoesterase family protein [Planctomycetota bacterium]
MPRLGLLSDSHGRGEITRRAVELLLQHRIDRLIHLGDICCESVLDAMIVVAPETKSGDTATRVPASLVLGNNDFDRDKMILYAQTMGLDVADPVGRMQVEAGELVYLHGDDESAMARALRAKPAYLCHGHSHLRRDERSGPTRIINPGALYRATEYSVAVLDTAADALTFYRVDAW